MQANRQAVADLAQDDLTVPVEAKTDPMKIHARDELGRMGETFNTVITQFQGIVESFRLSQHSLSRLVSEVAGSAEACG